MRTLIFFTLSILLWGSCRDDDGFQPLPCEDPSNDYYVSYNFENIGLDYEPHWLIMSDPDGYPRITQQKPRIRSTESISEPVCFAKNTITAIYSKFLAGPQQSGYISVNSFAEVPTQSRIDRHSSDFFSRSGMHVSSTITVTDVTDPVEKVICPYIVGYEQDEITHTLTLFTTANFISESQIWVQIQFAGEEGYHCREFIPFQDFGDTTSISTFNIPSFDRTLMLEHPENIDGWWRVYGMSTEYNKNQALVSSGNLAEGNLVHLQTPEDAYPFYLIKVISNNDEGDLFYENIYSEIPDAITPNAAGVSVSYTGTYPNYEIISENADLIEISFFENFTEDFVGVNWKVFLPGDAVQQVTIPELTSEILNSLPHLSQIDFENNFKINAYNYFQVDGYEEVQPYLFKKVNNRLWDFDSRYVKVSAPR